MALYNRAQSNALDEAARAKAAASQVKSSLTPQKVNLLGQPIVAEAPKPAYKPSGLVTRSGQNTTELKAENQRLQASADAEAMTPRSKAAKLMKRQAGIGQLKTMHVEDTL